MKNLGLLVFFLSAVFCVNAQSVSVATAKINPAPLMALGNNGTPSTGSFSFGEASGVDVAMESSPGVPNVTISVNLQLIELTSGDVNGISGTILNYFSASYNSTTNILTFQQNAVIPGDTFAEAVFPITVTENSTQAESKNGFMANLSATDGATNAQGNAAVFTYTNTVLKANDDLLNTVLEDSTNNNIIVLTNDDFGANGPSATDISITIPPTNGTASVNNGGTPNNPLDDTITYTPTADFNGSDTLRYQICDAGGVCDTALVVITVTPEEDVPVATNDPLNTVLEDSTNNNIIVLTNDDFGGDGPSATDISITTGPTNGTAEVNDGGTPNNPLDDTITYTPSPDYNGPDSLTYQICDANDDCDTAEVSITVTSVDDFPVAINDPVNTVDEDSIDNILVVLTNDDFGGDGPSSAPISIATPPTYGTATVNNGGTPNDPTDDTILYSPTGDYNGPDSLIYQICDADADCVTATVSITVNPVDDFPVAINDPVSVLEDSPTNDLVVLTNDDFGGDGPSTTPISITIAPAHGTATVNDGGTLTDPRDDTITYIPTGDYNGLDSITYRICDADGDCDLAEVSITVTSVDDFPEAVNDPTNSVTEDSINNNIVVLTNDDFGGDGPSTGMITITTDPSNGAASVDDGNTPNDPTDDSITYTPSPDYNGPDSITYQICDIDGDCDFAVVSITVTPVNDLPVATNDPATVVEDSLNNDLVVLTNDDFGGDGPSTGTITITTGPSNGTASVDDGGTPNDPTNDTITYTPTGDYNGPDSLIYQICDANDDCATATVSITVTSVDDNPEPTDDPTITVDEDSIDNDIEVLLNDDFGGDGPSTGTISITTQPTNGSALVDDGGTPNDPTDDSITYSPTEDFNGPDSIVYEICDADGDCETATVTITVSPILDVEDDEVLAAEDKPTIFDLFGNDSDLPTDGTITNTDPINGTVVITDPNGTPNDPSDDVVTYTPNDGHTGPDTFTYTVCDNATPSQNCETANVTITVVPVADLEDDPSVTTPAGDPVVVDVYNNDPYIPSNGDITTSNPDNGTVEVTDPNGTPNDPSDDVVTYTPDNEFVGEDTFTYTVCDALTPQNCDTATVTVTVTGVDLELTNTIKDGNTTPVVGTDQITFVIEVTNKGNVLATGVEVEDLLPTGYTFVSATLNPVAANYDDTTGVWTIGDIAPNETVVLELLVDVNESGEYNNCAEVIATNEDDVDSTPNNAETVTGEDDNACVETTPIAELDLAVAIEVNNAEPAAGEPIKFTVTITNEGPLKATDVTVNLSDEITNSYNYIGASDPADPLNTIIYDALTAIWSVGDLEPNTSKMLELTVDVIGTGDNTVTATRGELLQQVDTVSTNDSASVDVSTSELPIPEGFTPNGDGVNDVFVIPNLQKVYPDYELEIVNRYGNSVYKYQHNGNPDAEPIWWDGTSFGRMNLGSGILPTGTYFYVIDFKTANKKPKTGWVYLRK